MTPHTLHTPATLPAFATCVTAALCQVWSGSLPELLQLNLQQVDASGVSRVSVRATVWVACVLCIYFVCASNIKHGVSGAALTHAHETNSPVGNLSNPPPPPCPPLPLPDGCSQPARRDRTPAPAAAPLRWRAVRVCGAGAGRTVAVHNRPAHNHAGCDGGEFVRAVLIDHVIKRRLQQLHLCRCQPASLESATTHTACSHTTTTKHVAVCVDAPVAATCLCSLMRCVCLRLPHVTCMQINVQRNRGVPQLFYKYMRKYRGW